MPELNNKNSPNEEEPKIFSIYIDENNNKKFNRREFIRTATVVGTSITLAGCNLLPFPNDEESPDVEDSPSKRIPTKTSTAEVREEPTKKPTNTQTKVPTRTPTATEEPTPIGEVAYSHSLFKGPDTSHPFITNTVVGEEITILGKTSDGIWFKVVDSEGNIGWCYAEFITVITNFTIPVIQNIPTPVATTCTCDNYEPCDCDSYTPCSCDSNNSSCSCDEVCTCDTVHYWYPN